MRSLLLLAAIVAFAQAKFDPTQYTDSVKVEFGLYDIQASPGGGWAPMTAKNFEEFKNEFIASYNRVKGIKVIRPFKTGNCCVAVAGGKMLTISGTPYGYQFPAATSGGIRCNPTGGYAEAAYQFYRSPQLKFASKFASKKACKFLHNPAVFMRVPQDEHVQWKMYDADITPAGGWKLATAKDLRKYKDEFVSHYNSNNGLDVLKPFKSGNCCIAVAGGKMLIISGTRYGYQFPAATSGGIRCNPAGGYNGKYMFYRTPTLDLKTNNFGEKRACKADHNPAIYIMAQPKFIKPSATHCVVSEWSEWSECSKSCSKGVQTRKREVITHAKNGGRQCPKLEEKKVCMAKYKCCSHVTCRVREFRGHKRVMVMHDKNEQHGIHHICEVGLFTKGQCDCECGTLGVDIHSRMGHAPCSVWDSFKNCDAHRGSQDLQHNVIPTSGVLKIEAEYGYLSNMGRHNIKGMPRQRLNGEREKSEEHMYITPKGNAAGFAEWQIIVRKTAVYDFSFHFRNQGKTEQWQLKSHPGNWEAGKEQNMRSTNVFLPHAHYWDFADAKIVLQEGENTISIHTPGGGNAQIDFLRVGDYDTNFDLSKINDLDRSSLRERASVTAKQAL